MTDFATGTSSTDLIRIETKGRVPDREAQHLVRCLEKALRSISVPVLRVNGLLSIHEENDVAHQARAKASIELKGQVIRAEAYGPSIRDTIDVLETRLHQRLERRADRYRHDPHGREARPGEWQHGNRPTSRPAYFERPPEARDLVRHKTFAAPEATVEEACWDMHLLDYDFFLFRNADTGHDAVVANDDEGPSEAGGTTEQLLDIDDAPDLTVDGAIEWLDTSGQPFVFFRDTETERGAVIYRRYDGHYGLLTPR